MGSMLRRLGARLSRLINSKELVGQDVHGNKYYRWSSYLFAWESTATDSCTALCGQAHDV